MVTTTTKAKTTTAVARPVCWPWRSTTWRYRVTSHRPRPHAVSHSWFVVTAGFSGSVTLTGNINNRVIDSLASRRTSDDCHKQTMSSVIECVLATYVYELWRAESLLLRVICWTKKEWRSVDDFLQLTSMRWDPFILPRDAMLARYIQRGRVCLYVRLSVTTREFYQNG